MHIVAAPPQMVFEPFGNRGLKEFPLKDKDKEDEGAVLMDYKSGTLRSISNFSKEKEMERRTGHAIKICTLLRYAN